MIDLEERSDGIVLPVRAQPGARQNALRGVHNGALKVAVTQIAEKGKANKAVTRLLCKALSLRRSQIALIAGETSADKKFLVREIDRHSLGQRIAKLLS